MGVFGGGGGSIPSTSGRFNFFALYLKMSVFLIWHVIPFRRVREKGFLKLFSLCLTPRYVEMPGRRRNFLRLDAPFCCSGGSLHTCTGKAVHCISSIFYPNSSFPSKKHAMGLQISFLQWECYCQFTATMSHWPPKSTLMTTETMTRVALQTACLSRSPCRPCGKVDWREEIVTFFSSFPYANAISCMLNLVLLAGDGWGVP